MGVLDGIDVLDLSSGIAGPMTAMLLGDHGARVTRIERPEGDPFAQLSGYRVWNRGKRSAVLNLKDRRDNERFTALASRADVVIESFSTGAAARLGVDYETLAEVNPRLVYCSITGYGGYPAGEGRPSLDALVAARTGQQWEVRGTIGTTIAHLGGWDALPGLEAPPGCWVGPDREGPLFSGVPWPSVATFYIATLAINAALRAREHTARGQHVNASLLHGIMATTLGAWQKAEHSQSPNFLTWVMDPRAPKGFFQSSDGQWLHHWVPLPDFILGAAANQMRSEGLNSPRKSSNRIGMAPEEMVVLHSFQPQLAEAVAKFPSEDWVSLAAEVGVPVQRVRSPEEALLDPLLLADGCVTEVDDPELGAVRQVGRVIDMPRHPASKPRAAPLTGEHTEAVIAEADALSRPARTQPADGLSLPSPLDGIVVLDLGLAVAGPFGTQVLAQLGARVIKVNAKYDKYWFSNHIAMCCNRDKDSITLNLKDPEGMSVLHRLVERADVVQHNMRYDAAERLGVDYESLKQLNPRLIYCHTLGHEQGPRAFHPGNDQTGAALAGTEWLDGGLDRGGRPIWANISLGDTGNGFLSALGIVQALYDRDRTGEGQFVRTSILYAHLLNASMAWVSTDGSVSSERQRLDAEQYGWSALYRLYEASDGWLCLAAVDETSWKNLCSALDRADLLVDPRFSNAGSRRDHDSDLVDELTSMFGGRTAADWFQVLDQHGVPCEISDPDFVKRFFSDPEAKERQLVVSFDHPVVGEMTMSGLYFDLSDTPGKIWGPPVWPGRDTRRILAEIGYSADEIDKLLDSNVVEDAAEQSVL